LAIGKEGILKDFSLKKGLPIILVIGGGTGAQAINDLIKESIGELSSFCQIVHSTGKGKAVEIVDGNYHGYEFLDQDRLFKVLSISDLVITRAGIGTLTDLAAFKKPAIIIPMPNSHQEENAEYLAVKGAGLYMKQKGLTSEKLVSAVKDFLFDDEGMLKRASDNIGAIMKEGAAKTVAEIVINELLKR
jgi:UDP-N-acetylglucosamine--N-acetylmuramyl-(pentapeptide) pyrophosphoryl-undecaprenol N-acetylglucosamine transferase